MTKKIIIILLTLTIVGAILFTIGNTVLSDEASTITDIPLLQLKSENENIGEQQLQVDTTEVQSQIDNVTDINIKVMSADIYLIYGDEYSLKYNLHDREKIKTLDVSNGALNFDTTFNLKHKVDYGDWYVKVTIPKDSEINNLNLTTVAGDIVMEDAVVKNAKLKSTSGDIMLTGTFSDVDLYSVAGNISINGTISDCAKIETISGNIDVISTEPIESLAESIGKIKYNNKMQGYKFNNSQENDDFHFKSVSGKIQINDK